MPYKVSGTSVSGHMSFAITSVAGAEMMDDVTKCPAIPGMFLRNIAYAASNVPAVLANPPSMMQNNSDRVSRDMKGLIASGASVCPSTILAAVDSASAPEIRMVQCMSLAKIATSRGKKPTWYKTAKSAEYTMICGNTQVANVIADGEAWPATVIGVLPEASSTACGDSV
jgi:hypothetical protein